MCFRNFIAGMWAGMWLIALSGSPIVAQDNTPALPDLLQTATVVIEEATRNAALQTENTPAAQVTATPQPGVDPFILTATALVNELTQQAQMTATPQATATPEPVLSDDEAFVASATALISGLTQTVEAITPLPEAESFILTATGLAQELTRLAPSATPPPPATAAPFQLTATIVLMEAMTLQAEAEADAGDDAAARVTATPQVDIFGMTATRYVADVTATAQAISGVPPAELFPDARDDISAVTLIFGALLLVMGALLAVVYFSPDAPAEDDGPESEDAGGQH